MSKKKIDFYFKRSCPQDVDSQKTGTDNGADIIPESTNISEFQVADSNSHRDKIPRVEEDPNPMDIERDPGKRKMIWDYPVEQRDQIRRAYLKYGPYQVNPPKSNELVDKHKRKFLNSWYKQFPDWLEYSPSKNSAFCLQCFVFGKPTTVSGANTFVIDGFRAWKKVNDGKNCVFLIHEGYAPNSSHKNNVRKSKDMVNPSQHIDITITNNSKESIEKHRLRLRVSIDVAKLCAFQGIAFRGHNERVDSHNRGNFLEIIKHTSSYSDDVASVVLDKAPHNASYTSPTIQKEILSLYANKIQRFIRAEIGDEKFCIIVDESRDESKREQMAIVLRFVDKDGFVRERFFDIDESRDESKREQMAIVLRFVDKDGFVRERFFDIVHVEDTKAITLKNAICDVLSRHNLSIHNMRGQGYDGASNMRGEWNGLQALFLSECPYAYYVHCFAHRLQLILVATSESVIPIEHFFSHLNHIINVVDSSSKRHDQLQIAKSIQIVESTLINDLETGSGKNQVGTIQRPGDTRWSSHLRALHGLLDMFDPALSVLHEIINDKSSISSRAAADGAYDVMMSFEFVFILHFLIELLGRTDDLCRMLQCKSQDIINAMDAVAITKETIQKFRENGWDKLFEKVKIFCEKRDIDIPDMNGPLRSSKGRAQRKNPVTLEHHYRVDIFTGTIDCILQEMAFRFNDDAVELLKLSSVLDPRDGYKLFNITDICQLVEKFYPADFNNQEKIHLSYQLEQFELDIRKNVNFHSVSTLSELCQVLSKTGKSTCYYLVDRLIRLLLTLPVSTTTSDRAFSAMKIVKTRLRSKMEDDFLSSSLLMHIEKEVAQSFNVDSVIDEFYLMKKRRVPLM